MTNRNKFAADGIVDVLDRARNWAIHDALPFWIGTGFDETLGAFHERTDLAGKPVANSPRRTMSQARQIYVYSHAALLGWLPDGRSKALAAARALVKRHWRADGADGWVFSITADGEVCDAKRDAYAHAFGAFGLAWAYRLEPDPRFREVADQTFEMMDRVLAAPDFGGFLDAAPRPDDLRRQNPHMHYLEACLAWYEATGDGRYLGRAGEIFGLFTTRFLQPEYGILGEYFDDRWQPAAGDKGRTSEPGHHFEWVWLLRKFEAATGRNVSRYADALFSHATRFGGKDALLFEEVRDDGKVLKSSCRSWPYTEAVKAAAAEHEAGRPDMQRLAANWLSSLLDRHLSAAFPGGWMDQVDLDGQAMVDFAPASTLYHAFLAIAEADRVFAEPRPYRQRITPPSMFTPVERSAALA